MAHLCFTKPSRPPWLPYSENVPGKSVSLDSSHPGLLLVSVAVRLPLSGAVPISPHPVAWGPACTADSRQR